MSKRIMVGKKVVAVGDEFLIKLARSLGVKEVYLVSDSEVSKGRDLLDNLRQRKDVCVVLVSHKLISSLGKFGDELLNNITPVFITVPSYGELKVFNVKEFYSRKARKSLGVAVYV